MYLTRRFSEWTATGVFAAFWRAGLSADEVLIGRDGRWLAMDGARGKASLGGDNPGRNPTDRDKLGSKRSVLSSRQGIMTDKAIAARLEQEVSHDRHGNLDAAGE